MTNFLTGSYVIDTREWPSLLLYMLICTTRGDFLGLDGPPKIGPEIENVFSSLATLRDDLVHYCRTCACVLIKIK